MACNLSRVKSEPANATAHRRLGDTYLALGKKKEAASEWKEFLRLSPTSPDAEKVRADISSLH